MLEYPTLDSRMAADITFANVRVAADCVICTAEAADDSVSVARDEAIAALCAEASGAVQEILRMTVEYITQRRQFARALSEFQVLRHVVADLYIGSEQIRSMAYMAAASLKESPASRSRKISAAKNFIGRTSQTVGNKAIQLHGAIGTTDELPLTGYYKKLLAINAQYGTEREHLQRFHSLSI
jgi:alkylation response protein AidB-like acyl-CoA dehydrogenase